MAGGAEGVGGGGSGGGVEGDFAVGVISGRKEEPDHVAGVDLLELGLEVSEVRDGVAKSADVLWAGGEELVEGVDFAFEGFFLGLVVFEVGFEGEDFGFDFVGGAGVGGVEGEEEESSEGGEEGGTEEGGEGERRHGKMEGIVHYCNKPRGGLGIKINFGAGVIFFLRLWEGVDSSAGWVFLLKKVLPEVFGQIRGWRCNSLLGLDAGHFDLAWHSLRACKVAVLVGPSRSWC